MQGVWPKAIVIGVVAGFLSGLLGIGGGVVVVPLLVLWVGADQFTAAGTSVATIAVTAGAALLTFGIGDSVDWTIAGITFVGSATGAWLGARHLDRIPEWLLAGGFSILILVAAIRMWL